MKLHIHELETELSQKVKAKATSNVEAISLHLLKYNNPTGSIFIELRNDNGLIASSETISITSISSAPYFHGQVRFSITAQLKKNEEYYIVLKSSGYSFSEPNYIGWCTDFDFNTYDKNPEPTHLLLNPFDYEIWIKK